MQKRTVRKNSHISSSTKCPRTPRSHIASLDGLRALAILAVLAYHMGIPWAQGGFQGVTIMFILSGYLVTSGILAAFQKKHSFSLLSFYKRRVLRIFPLAISVIVGVAALCTIFNHVLLTKMRPDIIPSLTMTLNWTKIFAESSYFAEAGGPSPLTHFWTLAIELQFYLIWPLFMLLFKRLNIQSQHIKIGLLIAIGISALLMGILYVPGTDPTRVYYGSDTRVFNLLAGCLLAYICPLHKAAHINARTVDTSKRFALEGVGLVSLIGIVLIMLSNKGYEAITFRGMTQLTTLLGICALTALMPSGTLISKIMSVAPLRWIASRSYALYLWHYPIIQLLKNPNATSATPLWQHIVVVLLSCFLAELSFRFIEKPFKKPKTLVFSLKEIPQKLVRLRPSLLLTLSIAVIAAAGIAFVPPVNALGDGDNAARLSQATLRKATPEGVYDVVLVGDSVPLGAKDELTAKFPNGLIDCAVGRHINEAKSIFDQYLSQGVVGDIVIFSVASNGPLTQEALDELIASAGQDRQLYFLNCRIPDEWEDANNKLIAALPDKYSNVKIIDWFSLSDTHSDWFWNDGTHLRQGSPSIDAYVQMIYDAIDYDKIVNTPTSYDHLFMGDEIAIRAADSLAEAFPRGVVDCAANRSPKDIAKTITTYTSQDLINGPVIVALDGQIILQEKDIELLIKSTKGQTLYLVTARSLAPWAKDNNALAQKIAQKNKNVQIIDWYSKSNGHDKWFTGDGSHLSKQGIKAYTKLISESLSAQQDKADAQN